MMMLINVDDEAAAAAAPAAAADDDEEEEDRSQDREADFQRACAVEMHMDISQEPFCVEIYTNIPKDTSGDIVLCEPAQSKCTWAFHKSHFVCQFTGN